MMRYKLSYAVVIGLVLSACTAATATDSPSPTEAASSVSPTTTSATTTLAASSPGSVVTPPSDAIAIAYGQNPIDPGNYWIDHDGDPATSLRVDFAVADPGWGSLIGANKQAGEKYAENYVAVKFFAIDRVAKAACDGSDYLPAGETAEALAKQLAGIKDFETVEPLAGVTAFGYDGYHLALAVPPASSLNGDKFTDCDDGRFDSWRGPTFGRYYQGPGQVVEFWVLDVEGTLLSIEATWFPDSPAEDLTQLRSIIDSVSITP